MAKLEPRRRKIKILATIGPASREPEMLRRLWRAGADAFRINLSHGEHADHAKAIAAIRALEKEIGRPIAILCDLQGPKLRVGVFKGGEARIPHGARFTLDRNETPGDETRVFLCHDYPAAGSAPVAQVRIGDEKQANVHLRSDTPESDYIGMRERRDATLAVPKLLWPAIQFNIRGGRLPPPDTLGRRHFRLPVFLDAD